MLGKLSQKAKQEMRQLQDLHFYHDDMGPKLGFKQAPTEFYYRCENMFLDFLTGKMKLFIPFTGSEKVCWTCGGNRELVLTVTLEGEFIEAHDVCDK